MASEAEKARDPGEHEAGPGVGYGRPPVAHRFTKGRSGNPKGRPPKARPPVEFLPASVRTIVLDQMRRKVTIVEKDGTLTEITLVEAVARKLSVSLVSAPVTEQIKGLRLYVALEREELAIKKTKVDEALALKTAFELERCRKQGRPLPEPVPHPDDIAIDVQAGEVFYNGPANETEKAKWGAALASLKEAKAELPHLEQDRAGAAEPHIYDQAIRQLQQHIAFVERTYPTESERRVSGFRLQAWRDQQAESQRTQSKRRKAEKGARVEK